MNKISKNIKKILTSPKTKNIARTTLLSLAMFCILSITSFASIGNSKLVTGSQKLAEDILSALLVIIPIVSAVAGTYFAVRMSMADEQDKKTWSNRLKILGVGFILSITIAGLLKIIANYYK